MAEVVVLVKEELKEVLSEFCREMAIEVLRELKSFSPPALEMMTVRQLAEYLQVTEQSIFNWIKRETNALPVTYVGSDPRFCIKEVRQWMQNEAARQLGKNSQKRSIRKNNKAPR